MIEALQLIADANGLTFQYGESQALNISADLVRGTDTVLFHEGYVSGAIASDLQGAWEVNYSLKLWLLLPSNLADNPDARKPRFNELMPLLLRKILPGLERNYVLAGVSIVEGINLKDKNLDGLRITLSAKPKVIGSLC